MIIYDASAFVERVMRKDLDLEGVILDLTIYEVGNVLLKHHKHLKKIGIEEARSFLAILSSWKNILHVYPSDSFEIFEIALRTNLTVYDASYVFFSKKYNAILETSDSKIRDNASKECEVFLLKQ